MSRRKIVGDDDEASPVASSPKPKERARLEARSKAESKPTSAEAARPRYIIVGDNEVGPCLPSEKPEARAEVEFTPEVDPSLLPTHRSSATGSEKVIKPEGLATNRDGDAPKAGTVRKGKPRKFHESFPPPDGWAHVSGRLWKTKEGSPRHRCSREGIPPVFGLLKVRSRVECARCGRVLPETYEPHLSGHFLPADQRAPRPWKRKRRPRKPPTT